MVLLAFSLLLLNIFSSVLSDTDSSNNGVVFCYYGNWSSKRIGIGRFGVSDLPLDLCTHLIYSFIYPTKKGELRFDPEVTIEGKSNSVDDFIALKKSNNDLKLLVAIGGWVEGPTKFSTVVNDDSIRTNFVNNLVKYMEEKGFDGLDVDWEYPAQRGGAATDKEQFSILLKELKEAFEPYGYILTAAVGVTQENIDISYNVTALNEYLDYINLMTYDYHGAWDKITGVVAPLYAQVSDDEDSNLNVDRSVHTWIANGASPSKLVLGLAVYGRTFTLEDSNNALTAAPVVRAGRAGLYSGEAGFYTYFEIMEDQTYNIDNWIITEEEGNYAFASKDRFWVGYDNLNTIYVKGQYAKDKGLAGIMFWTVDYDDFQGLFGSKYSFIKQGIAGYRDLSVGFNFKFLIITFSLILVSSFLMRRYTK